MCIDTINNFMYLPNYDTNPCRIAKIDLSKLNILQDPDAYVMYFSTEYNENRPRCSVMDSENGFMYIGTDSEPWSIVKIDLSIPARVDSIVIVDEYPDYLGGPLTSAVIDTDAGFAYFGTDSVPGKIIKVDLTTFTVVDTLILEYGLNHLTSAVIDTFSGYAYFGTSVTTPGEVIKIRLSDFSYVANISTEDTDVLLTDLTTAVIDPYRGFAYFASGHGRGMVQRINLYSFSRAGMVEFNGAWETPYEAYISSSAIDISRNVAYFGTNQIPGNIIKVDLASFSRVGSITIDDGSYEGNNIRAGGGA